MTEEEQKTLFAERYLRRPDDALMIIANIVGKEVIEKSPMVPIALSQSWPNDPFVLAEIKRIKEQKPSLRERIITLEESFKVCMKFGEYKAACDFAKLIMQAEGHLAKVTGDDGKSGDRLHELAAALEDRDDNGQVLS